MWHRAGVLLLLSTSDTDLLSARASGADYRLANPNRVLITDLPGLAEGSDLVVLRLLGTGEPNAELARRLFVSEATVKTYVSRLLTKLDLTNRTQAAILAHEAGLLEG